MKLSKSFKPELLVADPDARRPQWEAPFLSGSTVVALNGQIMGVFPCERGTDDRDGIISLEAMSSARKATPAREPLQVDCGDRYVCANGASFPRPDKQPAAPNVEQVTPRDGAPIKIVVSAKNLETLMRALGGGTMEIEIREGGMPIILRPLDSNRKERINGGNGSAFGLIMTGKVT